MPNANVASRYLEEAIQEVIRNKDQYVTNPGKDFSRNRKLNLKDLIHFILGMRGGSLTKEMIKYFQKTNVPLTKSAFVQRRQKVKSSAFLAILHAYNQKCNFNKTHNGYRLLAVDGSDINIYPNEGDTYISPTGMKPYSLMHLNAMYDLGNNIYVDAITQGTRVSNEHAAMLEMCDRIPFEGKCIVIADRGYERFNNIAYFAESEQLELLLRARHGAGGIREIANLPMTSLDVDLTIGITTRQTKADKAAKRHFIQTESKKGKQLGKNTKIRRWDFASPYDLKIRVVRFPLETGEYETLITTLPRDKFSCDALKDLYHMRWGIETSFRQLKYEIVLSHIHTKGIDTALQEIFTALINYNYCESIIGTIVVYQCVKNKHAYVVNHTAAIYLCLDFFEHKKSDARALEMAILQHILPYRPGRRDKRKNIVGKSFCFFTYRVAA